MALRQVVIGQIDGSGNLTPANTTPAIVAPLTGSKLVTFVTRRGSSPDLAAIWTEHPHGAITPGSDGARMGHRDAGGGETSTQQIQDGIIGGMAIFWEYTGVELALDASSFADVDTFVLPSSVDAGTPAPTGPAVIIAGLCVHCSDHDSNGNTIVIDNANWTRDAADEVIGGGDEHPLVWGGHREVASGGAYSTSQGLSSEGPYNFIGWGGLAMAFREIGSPTAPGIEPGIHDPEGVFITDLEDAFGKSFRVELNGTGQFEFYLNRYSANATSIVLARDNVVKFNVPQISEDAIWAGFLETGDFELVSKGEKGGENLHFGGRGLLAYLERDVSWTTSYVLETEPTDGYWRFAPTSHPSWSTGNEPGQIIKRIIDEMQHPDRPQFCMDLLTVDFDYQDDSDGNPWTHTDATDPVWTVAVGEDVLTTVGRLIATGAIEVQMDTEFGLHAYNHYGRDLSGGSFGTGVVRFVKGVNIADTVKREWNGRDIAPYELVLGDAGAAVRAELPDFAARVQKVVSNTFSGTDTPTLEEMGLADLRLRLQNSESATFRIASRRFGSAETMEEGWYLPGPPGTNGDFWVGDTVRLVTGTDDVDYDEEDVRVAAITIAEDKAGNLMVYPELGSVRIDASDGSPTYGGGGIVAPPGVTGTSGVKDHGLLTGLADDDHPQYTTTAEATAIADAEVAVHTGDATDAHDASAISLADAGGHYTGTDVEAALQELPKVRVTTTDPTTGDDSGDGYAVLSRWINISSGEEFVAVDVTVGAAVWVSTTDAGGSGLPSPSTKGDLVVWDGSDWVILPAGTDGDVLTADSGDSTGLSYQTPTGGGGGTDPWFIMIDPFAAHSHTNFDSLVGSLGDRVYGAEMESTGAQNAERNWDFGCPGGTWTIQLLHFKGSNRGIYTVEIDGSSVGTIDGYTAGSTANVRDQITGVSIASGKRTISLKMLTKNTLSSNWFGTFSGLTLLRTA
jgi:hypothetical protein